MEESKKEIKHSADARYCDQQKQHHYQDYNSINASRSSVHLLLSQMKPPKKNEWEYINKILANHGYSTVPLIQIQTELIPEVQTLSEVLQKILSHLEKYKSTARQLQSKPNTVEADPQALEENSRLIKKISNMDEEMKELKTKIQQMQIEEKNHNKIKNENEILIKKLQTDMAKQKAIYEKNKKYETETKKMSTERSNTEQESGSNHFKKAEENRPKQVREIATKSEIYSSGETEKIVHKLKSELTEKDMLIRKLNSQIITKESEITELEEKCSSLEIQVKEAPSMSRVMNQEMLIKNYKEANESLKKRLALLEVKEETIQKKNKFPISPSMSQTIEISYDHSVRILTDMCNILEVDSAFDLVGVVTKYKRLVNSFPRMEKFIQEVKDTLRVEDKDRIIPELQKIMLINPHFQNKICKLVLLKDFSKATEAEIFEKINYLMSLEKGTSKTLTLEGHKLEIIENLEQILQTDWTGIIDLVTQLLLIEKECTSFLRVCSNKLSIPCSEDIIDTINTFTKHMLNAM